MRAAFGRQCDPGRGRHQDKPRILVAGIVQRILSALDEWVVECADRQQPRAEQRPGQPERGELQEQIALGDAELDVLSLRRHRPALRRDDVFLAKGVGALGAVEDPAAIDPGPEIGRDRDVGRSRHDTFGECRLARRDVAEQPAKGLLGRLPGAAGDRQAARHRYCGGVVSARARPGERHAFEKFGKTFRRQVEPGERLPFGAIGYRHAAPEGGHLVEVHQPGVVVLVPGKGQPVALDRVGDKAGRPIVLDRVEGGQDRIHVVAGEVGHQPLQRRHRRGRRGSRGSRDSG